MDLVDAAKQTEKTSAPNTRPRASLVWGPLSPRWKTHWHKIRIWKPYFLIRGTRHDSPADPFELAPRGFTDACNNAFSGIFTPTIVNAISGDYNKHQKLMGNPPIPPAHTGWNKRNKWNCRGNPRHKRLQTDVLPQTSSTIRYLPWTCFWYQHSTGKHKMTFSQSAQNWRTTYNYGHDFKMESAPTLDTCNQDKSPKMNKRDIAEEHYTFQIVIC